MDEHQKTRKWKKSVTFTKKPYLIANSVKEHKNASKYYFQQNFAV
jgi:hypothetical protein